MIVSLTKDKSLNRYKIQDKNFKYLLPEFIKTEKQAVFFLYNAYTCKIQIRSYCNEEKNPTLANTTAITK
mgnify:CR=1 FL=1